MVDVSDLVDKIVLVLKGNQPLVDLLGGDDASIVPYYQGVGNNLDQEVQEQETNSLLIAWRGTRTGVFNKNDAIKHDFCIYPKYEGKMSTLWKLLREGVSTYPPGNNQPFKRQVIDQSCFIAEALNCIPKAVFISPEYGVFDFTEISFTLTERGVDI